MRRRARSENRTPYLGLTPLLIFGAALCLWVVLAQRDVFHQFHLKNNTNDGLFSYDNTAALILIITLALALTAAAQAIRLRAVLRDRELARSEADRIAHHDALTGLRNRHSYEEYLHTIATNTDENIAPRVVAALDIDRFHKLNDLHGHGTGDFLLQALADRLRKTVGPAVTIARIEGDCFGLVFPARFKAQQAERLMRDALRKLAEVISHSNTDMQVTCSAGLAQWTPGMSAESVIARADKALRRAKTDGRARLVWYDVDLGRAAMERVIIENALAEAITKSEIMPWFQPIVCMKTGGISGFEVLARWHDPELGQISPAVFIEIAEECGLIGKLGFNLLRKACAETKNWNPSITISFNVSAVQFHEPDLVSRIAQTLAAEDFAPERLTIEITETTVISDVPAARDKILQLQALGISVALDDFGTGYSSLASLRHLPFDRIKIDRAFITGITIQPQNQKILCGIMALAKGLDLQVTAEGIETLEEMGFLQNLACPLAQGYLFEAALPADQVAARLQSNWKYRPFNVLTNQHANSKAI